jgi:hypothetical protein
VSLGVESVKGYSRALFERAGLDSFEFWWEHDDPALDRRAPKVIVVTDPRRVMERAQELAEDLGHAGVVE